MTLKRWYTLANGLKTRISPLSPTTRTRILRTVADHIEHWMRPVRPSANRSSAVIARSTSGERNRAWALITSGSAPARWRTMLIG